MTNEAQKRYFVESLARGLAVLSAFTPNRPELSLREVAVAAGVTSPSALRIGYTLVELGYLVRNAVTKGYRPGPKVLSLGFAALSSLSLVDIAEPFLIQLRDLTAETVKMAVLDGAEMVYVARFPSTFLGASGVTFVGSRMPAHQTCTGRAILSRLPDAHVRAILERSRFVKFTERSILDPEEVMTEIRDTRERGYAINDQGTTVEHRSAAVALLNASGKPVGAINVAVSAQRITLAELEERLVPHVVNSASLISALLPPQMHGPLLSLADGAVGWRARSA